jgi:large subunit ribosomal protein L4
MKVKIYDLAKNSVGEVPLDQEIFGLDARPDLIKRVIDWQLAKAMAGTHKVKTVSEVSGTTKKPFKQKGTGNARQGSLRSVQMRGGGIVFGPTVRSHAFDLPKKVRKLGLKHALSAKYAEGKLLVLSQKNASEGKTSAVSNGLKNFGEGSFFIVDGNELNTNFARSTANLFNVVLVPQIGANVYDIIRHDYLVLTEEGLVALEKRLTGKDTGEAKPVKAVKAKIEKTTEEKPAPKKKSAAPKEEKAAAPKKKAVTGKGATNA